MPRVNQDATVYRGGSYIITVKLVDENGAPFDPTGKDLFYRAARHAGETTAAISLSRSTITNEADEVSIPLETATTKDLSRERYYHELFMIDEGERSVLMTGTLSVAPAQAALYTPA